MKTMMEKVEEKMQDVIEKEDLVILGVTHKGSFSIASSIAIESVDTFDDGIMITSGNTVISIDATAEIEYDEEEEMFAIYNGDTKITLRIV